MPATRIGFLPAPGMDYDRAFDMAVDLGFDFVEVYAEGEPWREGPLSTPALGDRLADRGLDLMTHLPFPIGIGSPLEATRAGAREDLRRYVRAAGERGAEKGVLHLNAGDARAANLRATDRRESLLEAAAEIVPFAAEHDFEICVENLPSGAFELDDFNRLFEETDASMTLDTGHAILSGHTAAETAAFIEANADRISHMHLNDNRKPAGSWGGGDEHLPFGSGAIDFETLLEPVRTEDWTGTLSFEVVTWDRAYMALSKEKLEAVL